MDPQDREIPLAGGRITPGVARRGAVVLRPVCANGAFVHRVLLWLEGKQAGFAPRYLGLDEMGREKTSFLEGRSPSNLGWFADEQCVAAARIIRALHDGLGDFPGCPPGLTVCHNDLSPCNFMFCDGMPYAVFDWDSAAFGDPLDDLAYALWMWLDMGNGDLQPQDTVQRALLMLDAYGVGDEARRGFCARVDGQMRRVAAGQYPTEEQRQATARWAMACSGWLVENGRFFPEDMA